MSFFACKQKKIYIGEMKNLKNRFSETRKMLHNGNHTYKELVADVQKYEIHCFCFIPLHYGTTEWEEQNTRLEAEKTLISRNSLIVYNTQHSAKTNQKRENPQLKQRPDFLNGFPLHFFIEGQSFQGLSTVRCTFGISRKKIIRRINDNENFSDWQLVEEPLDQFFGIPEKVYLIHNKVFKSQRSILRHPDFQMLSRSGINNRLKSKNFPEWQVKTRQEFLQLKEENPLIVFEFMWQRSNDHPSME